MLKAAQAASACWLSVFAFLYCLVARGLPYRISFPVDARVYALCITRSRADQDKEKDPRLASPSVSLAAGIAGTFMDNVIRRSRLHRAQVLGGRLTALPISDDIERDLLSFAERAQAGALDCADMNEHILAAIIRLDEAEAFLAIEPLHCSVAHGFSFAKSVYLTASRTKPTLLLRCGERSQSGTLFAVRPSRSAQSQVQHIIAIRDINKAFSR